MDFVFDRVASGRTIKCLAIVDDATHEAIAVIPEHSIGGDHLVRLLDEVCATRGRPAIIRTDNGPEFLGEVFTSWAKNVGMAIRYIQPGKPNQNAYIERFNRTYREEVLDQHLFTSLEDVREATYWWMIEYNEERPHNSLGNLTPLETRQKFAENSTFPLCA